VIEHGRAVAVVNPLKMTVSCAAGVVLRPMVPLVGFAHINATPVRWLIGVEHSIALVARTPWIQRCVTPRLGYTG
jgi:hypothetical protein